MNEPALVEVYRAKNGAQAILLQQALAEAGIDAAIENDYLQGVLGEVPAWNAAPRIMVESAEAPRARELLLCRERWDRAEAAAPGDEEEATRCLACGARMQEEDEKCPACGWSYCGG